MNRRGLLALLGGVGLALPVSGMAQQAGKLPTVGVLQAAPIALDPSLSEFVNEFRKLGYEDGRNVRLVLRSIDGRTWQRINFPEMTDLTSVRATDARTASISTADGRTFSTSNGGQTWTVR